MVIEMKVFFIFFIFILMASSYMETLWSRLEFKMCRRGVLLISKEVCPNGVQRDLWCHKDDIVQFYIYCNKIKVKIRDANINRKIINDPGLYTRLICVNAARFRLKEGQFYIFEMLLFYIWLTHIGRQWSTKR